MYAVKTMTTNNLEGIDCRASLCAPVTLTIVNPEMKGMLISVVFGPYTFLPTNREEQHGSVVGPQEVMNGRSPCLFDVDKAQLFVNRKWHGSLKLKDWFVLKIHASQSYMRATSSRAWAPMAVVVRWACPRTAATVGSGTPEATAATP